MDRRLDARCRGVGKCEITSAVCPSLSSFVPTHYVRRAHPSDEQEGGHKRTEGEQSGTAEEAVGGKALAAAEQLGTDLALRTANKLVIIWVLHLRGTIGRLRRRNEITFWRTLCPLRIPFCALRLWRSLSLSITSYASLRSVCYW